MVEYEGIFGPHTTLRYTPTFGGFKEDIILSRNIGVNEFSFVVDAGELMAALSEGGIDFLDPLTGESVARMSSVFIYDSFAGERTAENPHNSFNNTISFVQRDDGYYLITIAADQDFLNDPDTVYPVFIDPSTTFNVGSSGIEDVPIYSGRPRYNHGQNTYNHIGYVDSNYKVGRLLVKFPGLRNDSRFTNTNHQLTNVTYYNYSLGGSTGTTISAYRYMGAGWTETGAKCNIITWNGYTDLQDSKTVGSGGWYGFNITRAAQLWQTSSSTASLGLMLKNSNESSASYDKPFASAEYTAVSGRTPYVQVTYTDYVPVSQVCLTPTTKEMSVNDTAYLTATVVPSNATNKGIIWSSSNTSVVTVGSTGLICAGKAGTATIYARSSDNPNAYAVCTVRVKYCGDQHYQDVTQHAMVMQSDGYYRCSVCGYRVISPILQDKDILSQEDYLKVISCEQSFIYYSYLVQENLGGTTLMYTPYGLLKLIDDIRSQPQYAMLYDFKDGSGKYYRSNEELYTDYEPTNGDGPVKYYLTTLRAECIKITNANILFHNGVIEGIVEIGIGLAPYFWGVPADLISVLLISMQEKDIINNTNTFLQMLVDQITDRSLAIPLSLLLDIITLGSTSDDIQVGDYVVKITMLNAGEGYKTKMVYNSSGSLKKSENEHTWNY